MTKYWPGSRLGLLAILTILMLVGLTSAAHRLPESCNEQYRSEAVADINGRFIQVEIADTDSERSKGLSGRQCISENQGMLFIFDEPGYYNFWMKEMKFPIDIVWVDSQKRVIDVTENIQPSTFPDTFVSNGQPQYVLELKANHAAELGIRPGSRLHF